MRSVTAAAILAILASSAAAPASAQDRHTSHYGARSAESDEAQSDEAQSNEAESDEARAREAEAARPADDNEALAVQGDAVAYTDAESYGLEALYGTAGFFVGALVGGVGGYALTASSTDPYVPLMGVALGGVVGATLGLPAGVTLAGAQTGADGSYWAALGGELVGALAYGAFTQANRASAAASVAGPVLLIGGAIVGYELSASRPSTARASAMGVGVSPRAGGAVLGLSGRW